ncbi:site-specific DNA-methyltransferase [candidate division KSB1 bacterium]|nr:site-specific DNA-methyltransferase [candidate division KSB1 bacterium]
MIENYLNKIILGDCLEIFSDIPDNIIDVTFADPPFNLNKKYNNYRDSLEFKEYLNWCKKWIHEMVRVTKPNGSIFLHNIPKWLTYYSGFLNEVAEFKHWISWDAPTAPMGKSLQPSHYGILYYAKELKNNKYYEIRYPHKRCRRCGFLLKDYGGKKSGLHPFGPLVSDVWTDIHRIKHNKYRDIHPCQLPIHLLERILLMTSDENDVILDPFSGTGTTAIAAKRLGRNYIGFDIDNKYVEISSNKLQIEQTKSKIGNAFISIFIDSIVTLRDKDWNQIEKNYFIPKNKKLIDSNRIVFKEKNNILQQLDYNDHRKRTSNFHNQLSLKLDKCNCHKT